MTRIELIGDCYEMAESLISYGYCHNPEEIVDDSYMKDYVEQLGKNTVARIGLIVAGAIESIDVGCYTDGEGCYYNSTNYKPGSIYRIDL